MKQIDPIERLNEMKAVLEDVLHRMFAKEYKVTLTKDNSILIDNWIDIALTDDGDEWIVGHWVETIGTYKDYTAAIKAAIMLILQQRLDDYFVYIYERENA